MSRKNDATKRPDVGAWVFCALTILAASPAVQATEDFAVLFEQNCAPCHGAGGAGLEPGHPRLATFETPPAVLTDPLFNSREPFADWFLVTQHGGPALGLSTQMPAFGGAFTDEQIEGLIAHMKVLVDTAGYPPGDLNFARPVETIKPFPEDEALLLNRYTSEDGKHDVLQTTLYYAHRLGKRSQIELKAVHVDDGETAEFEAAELGWKHAFYYSLDRMLLLGGGLEVEIPIDGGDEDEVWVPYLSFAKGLGDFTLQGTMKSHLPADDFGTGDAVVSAVLHYESSPWPRGAVPGLEGKVTVPFESEADLAALLIPQVLIRLNRLGHVQWGIGVEIPLTGIDYDYRVRTFFLLDYADGGLTTGW